VTDRKYQPIQAQLGCYDAFCTDEGEVVISVEGVNKTCSEGKNFVHFGTKKFQGDIWCPDKLSFCR
jgi:hypothetical protein